MNNPLFPKKRCAGDSLFLIPQQLLPACPLIMKA